MIPAAEDGGSSAFLAGDRVSTVTADVVEGADEVVFAADEEDGEVCYVEGLVGSWFGELVFVG